MANYVVEAELLVPFLPKGTELDTYADKHYISLVAFSFLQTKVRGISFPFHRNFVEVNLRFYVRRKTEDGYRRGVVFIKEIVPRALISFVANVLYNENYTTMKTFGEITRNDGTLQLHYQFGRYNHMEVLCSDTAVPIQNGSMEAFITEHYWGYAGDPESRTNAYQVEHPKWDILPVQEYLVTCDFEKVYGSPFAHLQFVEPESVLTAVGSDVLVYSGNKI